MALKKASIGRALDSALALPRLTLEIPHVLLEAAGRWGADPIRSTNWCDQLLLILTIRIATLCRASRPGFCEQGV